MELVYLWVEKYKNIENQGFNFSPRFTCELKPEYEEYECCTDKKIKLRLKENSKLEYKKNKDTIDIFPDNINITALVGENGSGKSSLILELLYTGNLNQSDKPMQTMLWVYNKDRDKPEYIDFENYMNKKTQVFLFEEDIDSPYYNNSYSINHHTEIKDNYKRNNVVIALLGFDKNQYNLKNLIFIPTDIELSINNKIEFDFTDLLTMRIEEDDVWNDTINHIPVSIEDVKKLKEFLRKELNKSIEICRNSLDITHYMYIKEFMYKLEHNNKNSINIFKELFLNSFHTDSFITTLEDDLYSQTNEDNFKLLIKRLNQLIKIKGIENDKITVSLNNTDVEQILKNTSRDFFDIDFFKTINATKIYFKHLSSGEQKLLLLFGKLNYVVRQFDMKHKENFILLLDEPDVYLHPDWQKKLISDFINFIQNNNYLNKKNIHIVISSHSPFILSDLPKENVIFLENGEQKYPFKDNQQTFGANIHTLLSHGFFMKDGLMGEFAKDKINEAIKYLNQKTLTEKEIDYCENIISIIGEPIIKNQLQRMLDSKRLSEIDQIKQEIKRLEDRMTLIWKNSK